jgi:hypothetical protein
MIDEGFLVARYLYEQRADGRYVPAVNVQLPGKAGTLVITDPEGRTYRDLNRALERDFWLLFAGEPSMRPVADSGHADLTTMAARCSRLTCTSHRSGASAQPDK